MSAPPEEARRSDEELQRVQRWMQAVLMHPGDVAEAIVSPQAQAYYALDLASLDGVIAPSRALNSAQRLEIYVDAYFARLMECLAEEFAATRYAVGQDLFDALAFGYLQAFPSRSYTLHDLGGSFPNYLRDTRLHEHDAPAGAPGNWGDFIVDLATFERSQREIFDGPGIERMETSDWPSLQDLPPDQLAALRLTPAPCLRLHVIDHPVHDYWLQHKAGDDPCVPDQGVTYLALHRRDYQVQRHDLAESQYRLLASLVAGQTLQHALSLAATHDDSGTLARHLSAWFATWRHEGFFTALITAPPSE